MNSISDNLKELRHWLHAHPEISGEEKNTAGFVTEFIKKIKPDELLSNIGGHGVLALFDSGKPGLSLLFRSELDALPIQEVNEFEYRSLSQGISHKCGHDGHMAILCGLAAVLAEKKSFTGKVYLLFQPAEENGQGARLVAVDPHFTILPDYVFALHNLPGFQKGAIVVKEGLFSAAVNSIIIKLNGKTAHAAEPEMGCNPAMAISEIIKMADGLSNNKPQKKDFRVITPVHINMGTKAYGVAAGYGELHYTLRCWDNASLLQLQNDLIVGSEVIAKRNNIGIAFSFTETFYANNNNSDANKVVMMAASQLGYEIQERDIPFKWGEDFGFFTSEFTGCMFGLGAGITHPALHNPDYDFPDTIIENGVSMFYTIIQLLSGK